MLIRFLKVTRSIVTLSAISGGTAANVVAHIKTSREITYANVRKFKDFIFIPPIIGTIY